MRHGGWAARRNHSLARLVSKDGEAASRNRALVVALLNTPEILERLAFLYLAPRKAQLLSGLAPARLIQILATAGV